MNLGGSGIRTELRDLETGIRKGWAIPPETLAAVPEKMLNIVQHGNHREATAAARVLVAMAQHNAAPGPSSALHLHQHQTAEPLGFKIDPDEPFNLEARKAELRQRIERLQRLGRL